MSRRWRPNVGARNEWLSKSGWVEPVAWDCGPTAVMVGLALITSL